MEGQVPVSQDEARRLFLDISNEHGVITRSEIIKLLPALCPTQAAEHDLPQQDVDLVMSQLDLNGDGVISFPEVRGVDVRGATATRVPDFEGQRSLGGL